jgi:hypothetical protein
MKKYLFYFVILIALLYSCAGEKQHDFDLISLITQTLSEKIKIKESDKNLLCIFVSDNMCSACIEKEFINIKSDSIPVTIIGIFGNKRNFISSTNQISWENSIFIERKEQHKGIIISKPFYFIFNFKEKNCTEIFYPDPCNEEKTLSYYQKIINLIE